MSEPGLAEAEELGSNILQVGLRNRANSHAMQRTACSAVDPARPAGFLPR
jgi:hypothetical protein